MRREGGDGWMIADGRDWTCAVDPATRDGQEKRRRLRLVCVRKWWLGGGARILPRIMATHSWVLVLVRYKILIRTGMCWSEG